MIDHHARHHKRRLFRPLVRTLGGVPAWAVTLVGFGAGMLAIGAAFQGATVVALALWMVNRVLDGLDGEVARAWKRRSDLGGYLDLLADFVVYAFLPIALAASHPAPGVWLTLAAMLAAFYLNAGTLLLLSALMEKRTLAARTRSHVTSVAIPSGLVEGAETFVLFALFLLVPSQLPLLFGLTAGLVAVTAIQRVIWASRALHRPVGETRDAPTERVAPRAA